MDKKITKYKLKKNKLEEKIIDILNLKKEYYENTIINSNNNEIITNKIENFFHNLKSNLDGEDKEEQLIIIIFGFYSVGKTTFISHLENFICIKKNLLNINSNNLVQKYNINSNNLNNLNNFKNLDSKILIIESNIDDIEKINSLIEKKNIININIIEKNFDTLKNKIINKIILDIRNKTDNFITNIKNLNIINNEEVHNLINHINLLQKKSDIFLDDDFKFIDETIGLYHKNIINNISNINLPIETHKYYL